MGVEVQALSRSYGLQSGGAGRRHRKNKGWLRVPLMCGADSRPVKLSEAASAEGMCEWKGGLRRAASCKHMFALPQIYAPIVSHVGDGKLPPFATGRAAVGR